MKNLFNKPQEKAVVSILQDAIIFKRVADRMYDIVNAFNPVKHEHAFETENQHIGIKSAFYVIGIFENDDLCEQLSDIFFDTLELKETQADTLAETIYIDWLVCIKNYCATLQTVA